MVVLHFYFQLNVLAALSLSLCLSAFNLFSIGIERYCREIDALLPLHEVPGWNIVPPSDHCDWLPLATVHITDYASLDDGDTL
jgi:hypothetical protein